MVSMRADMILSQQKLTVENEDSAGNNPKHSDELPQLWCILLGTMLFIGYRSVVLFETHCNEMRRRLPVFIYSST